MIKLNYSNYFSHFGNMLKLAIIDQIYNFSIYADKLKPKKI